MLVPVLHLLPSRACQHLSWRGVGHALPYAKEQAVGWLHGGRVCRLADFMGVWEFQRLRSPCPSLVLLPAFC